MRSKLVDFFIDEGDGIYKEKDRDDLTDLIDRHLSNSTIVWLEDDNGQTIAAARFNWISSKIAFVIEAVVKKEHRNRFILRRLCDGVKAKYKGLKFIGYERVHKKNKKSRMYQLNEFLSEGRR